MHMKTAVSYRLTPVRMATISKTDHECWRRCGEKRLSSVVGWAENAATVEFRLEISQNWSCCVTLMFHSGQSWAREPRTLPRRSSHSHLCWCFACFSKGLNQPCCPSADEWIIKCWCIRGKATQFWRKMKLKNCRKMDEPRMCSVKGNQEISGKKHSLSYAESSQ